jgi:hypothetical protein
VFERDRETMLTTNSPVSSRNHHRWYDNNRDHDDWNDHRDNLIFVYDDDDFDYDFDYDFDDDDYPYYWGYYPYWGWGGGCEGPVCLID